MVSLTHTLHTCRCMRADSLCSTNMYSIWAPPLIEKILCIVLEATLLILDEYSPLVTRIWVNFDPAQEIWLKVGGGHSFAIHISGRTCTVLSWASTHPHPSVHTLISWFLKSSYAQFTLNFCCWAISVHGSLPRTIWYTQYSFPIPPLPHTHTHSPPLSSLVSSPDPTLSRGEMVWWTKSNFLG